MPYFDYYPLSRHALGICGSALSVGVSLGALSVSALSPGASSVGVSAGALSVGRAQSQAVCREGIHGRLVPNLVSKTAPIENAATKKLANQPMTGM